MATHTTCDGCGADMTHCARSVRVDTRGALRLRDTDQYDLCPTCWDTGLAAMTARAAGAVKAVADLAAQRRRDVPVDRPPVGFDGQCVTCGERYDLNSVDSSRVCRERWLRLQRQAAAVALATDLRTQLVEQLESTEVSKLETRECVATTCPPRETTEIVRQVEWPTFCPHDCDRCHDEKTCSCPNCTRTRDHIARDEEDPV